MVITVWTVIPMDIITTIHQWYQQHHLQVLFIHHITMGHHMDHHSMVAHRTIFRMAKNIRLHLQLNHDQIKTLLSEANSMVLTVVTIKTMVQSMALIIEFLVIWTTHSMVSVIFIRIMIVTITSTNSQSIVSRHSFVYVLTNKHKVNWQTDIPLHFQKNTFQKQTFQKQTFRKPLYYNFNYNKKIAKIFKI